MTAPLDLDRILGRWLEAEVETPAPSELLASVLTDTSSVRPRQAWLARLRWSGLSGGRSGSTRLSGSWAPARLTLVAVIALIIVAILAAALAVGSRRKLPAPFRLPAPFGPAANGLIAYAANGDIYLGDPVTGQVESVTAGPELDVEPVFSPDGTHFAFLRSSGGSSAEDIVVASKDGSDPIVVTPSPVTGLTWLDWTPDSRSVGFVSDATGRALQIVASDGKGVHTLVDDLAVDAPAFRPPDGATILFRGQSASGVGLYTMRTDGTGPRQAVIPPRHSNNEDYDLREPRYSPDGSLIAYHEWSDELGEMRLYVMNADGTGARQLPQDRQVRFQGWPVWSPDGTRLAVQRMARGDSQSSIAVIAVDGLTPGLPVGPSMSGEGLHVEWSPDGTRLLAKSDVDGQILIDPGGDSWQKAAWTSTSFPTWQRLAP